VVYPTRRSASVPQRIYDATRQIATTAHLTNDGLRRRWRHCGIPFPLPSNGLEVIWNHLLRYRGDAAVRYIGQAAPQRNGSYALVQFQDEFLFNYARPELTPEQFENTLVYFKQATLAPARLAGSVLVVHETLDQVKEERRAWIYNPGQRRVRRAPNVSYDGPGTNADGMRTSDQFDMFNGAPDRYTWELVGKREMIMPYNSYRLHGRDLKYRDILKPLHINQDLARYELHRVWVVEARLKPAPATSIRAAPSTSTKTAGRCWRWTSMMPAASFGASRRRIASTTTMYPRSGAPSRCTPICSPAATSPSVWTTKAGCMTSRSSAPRPTTAPTPCAAKA
jgi:hypothetical protein